MPNPVPADAYVNSALRRPSGTTDGVDRHQRRRRLLVSSARHRAGQGDELIAGIAAVRARPIGSERRNDKGARAAATADGADLHGRSARSRDRPLIELEYIAPSVTARRGIGANACEGLRIRAVGAPVTKRNGLLGARCLDTADHHCEKTDAPSRASLSARRCVPCRRARHVHRVSIVPIRDRPHHSPCEPPRTMERGFIRDVGCRNSAIPAPAAR